MRSIARISISPVKAFRLVHPEEVELGPDGVAENRRFFLVGPDGERLRSSLTPWPVLVRAEYDAGEERLRMEFPRGTEIEGAADALGDPVHSATGSLDVTGRVVEGPWEAPLSELAGHPAGAHDDRLAAILVALFGQDDLLMSLGIDLGDGANR